MSRISVPVLVALGAAAVAITAPDRVRAAEAPPPPASVVEAIRQGAPIVSFNYRFESVDDDAFDKDAQASTLRTAIGWKTASYRGVAAHVEFANVTDLGFGRDHNDGGYASSGNGVTDRPAIVDPELTEVQQAFVAWSPRNGVRVALGRQELVLQNQRFLGPVGWRQNHQAFDGIEIGAPIGKRIAWRYAYFGKVNQISGRNLALDAHVAEAIGSITKDIKLAGYALFLDFEDLPAVSTRTIGARLDGVLSLGARSKLAFDLEAAQQDDFGDNPDAVDALYTRAKAGLVFSRFEVSGMWEVLGASAEEGRITTPLATLHAWNGWADKFLVTPSEGIVDLALGASVKLGRFKAEAIYHDFSADEGGEEWGTELDLLATYDAPWKQSFSIKAARYEADAFARDTTKVWIYTAWKY